MKGRIMQVRFNINTPGLTGLTPLSLLDGWNGRYNVDFVEYLDDVVLGGMTFTIGNIIVE